MRAFVFGSAKLGDKEVVQAEIGQILAKQLPDGRLSDDKEHSFQFTAQALIRLAEMGGPAGRPEVQKAIAAIVGKNGPSQADPFGIYDVRAFCLLGMEDRPEVRQGLDLCMKNEKEWNGPDKGCPWTPIEHLITLWRPWAATKGGKPRLGTLESRFTVLCG